MKKIIAASALLKAALPTRQLAGLRSRALPPAVNTGVGAGTLVLNGGDANTATGAAALLLNTTGANNTANGAAALVITPPAMTIRR